MYYPKQIPYLLDKQFKENVEYTEHVIKELENYCMCLWKMKSKRVLDQMISNYILPDACIDIVIDFVNNTICFAGFSKKTEDFHLSERIDYMGVRLKPGVFYLLFNVDASSVMNKQISFNEIEEDVKLDRIFDLKTPEERLVYLKNYLIQKTNKREKTKFLEAVEELYKSPKEQSVMEITDKFGYGQRHIYRIFKTYFGVSPKVLLNIFRLHLCLTLMLEENMGLVDIANLCGFYDQSHFIKEIKKYTGISPLKIMEDYR